MYQDAGVFRLDRATAQAITAWTTHRWLRIPSGQLPPPLPFDEEGRVFFAAGFPGELVRTEEGANEVRASVQYFVAAWHRHSVSARAGAMSFDLSCRELVDLSGNRVGSPPNLKGMSGAPLWTLDANGQQPTLTLVGVHCASSADVAIGVSVRRHVDLLDESGWRPA
jgi:hypothetical protein